MSNWGAYRDNYWAWDWNSWRYVPWQPAIAAQQERGKGVDAPAPHTGKRGGKGAGGGAPPTGKGDGKGAGYRPRAPPPELAMTWRDVFPHGHFVEAYWPVTKAAYPSGAASQLAGD